MIKRIFLRILLLAALTLLSILLIFINNKTKFETFYWPDASRDELFKYEYFPNVYYEHIKQYKIEIRKKDDAISQVRFIEEMNIGKGHEKRIEALKKFYQNKKESDVFNYDIVSFEYALLFSERQQCYELELRIVVNCDELDIEEHKNLIEYLGLKDSLDGNLLSYDLYTNKLFSKGFEVSN